MGTAILSLVGIGLGVAGGVQKAQGEKLQGQAQSESYAYQAQVAENNARMAQTNAAMTGQQGEIESTNSGLKTAAEVSGMKARQAASGVDVNSGSAVDARDAALRLGQIDAMTIKSNRAREAWGYNVERSNEEIQAQLDRRAGMYAVKGASIASTSTLLATAGNFASGLNSAITSGVFPTMGGSASGGTPTGRTWEENYG